MNAVDIYLSTSRVTVTISHIRRLDRVICNSCTGMSDMQAQRITRTHRRQAKP